MALLLALIILLAIHSVNGIFIKTCFSAKKIFVRPNIQLLYELIRKYKNTGRS